MDEPFLQLSDQKLTAIASGLKSGRLSPPFRSQGLQRFVDTALAGPVAIALQEMTDRGFTPEMVSAVIQMLIRQRESLASKQSTIELVTSGPEAAGIANRDTAIVVRELFARAERSVLVVGYAIYQGKRVFEALADRMRELPELEVTMCLDVNRDWQDKTKPEIVLSRFIQRFKDHQWPTSTRLPQIYFDPRSIRDDGQVRSSLHAKAIVVDRKNVFVSSANFTEAAQDRNIEVGLLIESAPVAAKIVGHFETLVDRKILQRAI
jgi:hypothetical protein